jgi:hypothetical protein
MQFTNPHGNGTYSLVVRRCTGAQLDPNFERGAIRLPNAPGSEVACPCVWRKEASVVRAVILVGTA